MRLILQEVCGKVGEKNVGSCGGICERFVKLCGSRGLGFQQRRGRRRGRRTGRTLRSSTEQLIDDVARQSRVQT